MIDSTISRARMHDLTGLGRVALGNAGGAGSPESHASPRRHLTDAPSIDEAHRRGTPHLMLLGQPSVGRSRPGRDDLVESII
jgi:hypothetical protein